MVKIKEYEEQNVLHPTVSWAQRKETISLKVHIANAKAPTIHLTESTLKFQVEGSGAGGSNLYEFFLEFYKPIDQEGCVYKSASSCIEMQLTKLGRAEWWPRLIPENMKKPHFLKLDFDKWMSESDEENEELQKKLAEAQKSQESSFEETEKAHDVVVNFYLAMYNGVQFLLFCAIFLSCILGRILQGSDFQVYAYKHVGRLVTFAVLLSYLETMHSIVKFVKTPWFFPFMQVSGRCFVTLCLWLGGSPVQEGWAVWYLFAAWSGAEVIRYPTYLLQILRRESKYLTWLRYNAWMILYPFGTFCEYCIFKEALVLFEEHGQYIYEIPGPVSFTLRLADFIKVYIVLLVLGISVLMRHMWKLRKMKYGLRKKFKPA
ncbi:very-long-chain (3R)-3-hydroxyacyl-CoA dehydratase 3-like isoform X1 [Clavelina lepadiformis]|uniref:very-long-chain (3R)-3-hydroxyacyl-CoA dehydratase 3-like isoform X1 n=2 Tax=Clavelina lepadiformis TaxID=159417 RepID=UPI0040421F5C